jgi:hypothetical protein
MHVVIHVVQQPRSIDGTVEVIDAKGARSTRKVTSTQCAEIVSAAALVVALAIDDAAESAPAPKPPPPPPTENVTPTVAPITIDTSERASRPSNRDLAVRVGAQGAVQVGVTPTPIASLPIFVELGSEARTTGFHFEPRARLSWTFAARSRGSVSAGSATFDWMTGAIDLCPMRFALTTAADVRACLAFAAERERSVRIRVAAG